MKVLTFAFLAIVADGGGGGGIVAAAEGGGLAGRVTWWCSPEYRRSAARLAELRFELERLPELLPRPAASRYGFRSEALFEPDEPQWVQIDLGRETVIDRIVAMPVHIPAIGEVGEGYGFPRRFKIEVADDPGMEDAVVVVDRTAEDVPNPGRHPLDFRIGPMSGRYVRFTSTRHFPAEAGFLWALEELMVLSGNRLAGVGGKVTASSSVELFPNWAAQRVNDGFSALGMPLAHEASPTRGYLSAVSLDRSAPKWLMVDLEDDSPIDEVRLVPVDAEDFEVPGARGFPRDLRIELALDAEFREVVGVKTTRSSHPAVPMGSAVVMPFGGARARYVRLMTAELWQAGEESGYGLAELQVYSGDRNVALGRPVAASDAADASAEWAPAFVVNGHSSRHRLAEWPEFLDQIGRRADLEQELLRMTNMRDRKVRLTGHVLAYGGGGLGVVAALGWISLLMRQRKIRRDAVLQLREQIARDLHDDIGSNLGGIVLLSEMGSRHSPDAQTRQDFEAIHQAAEETSKSMQDIVWLIGHGNAKLRDLVARMRQATRSIAGGSGIGFTVDPPDFRDRELPLLFRRHVFFAFKETLNNVRRHAAASQVDIRVEVGTSHFVFTVRDNGLGFDPANDVESGHGLANLRRRAGRLGGKCRIDSRRGHGTCVTFKAPVKSRS